jgi:hypothetical protein
MESSPRGVSTTPFRRKKNSTGLAGCGGLSVHFGCGLKAPVTWVNFDVSPSLVLSRLPLLLTGLFRLPKWPPNVRYGNIVTGLPLPDSSCRRVFADQVLEHLAYEDARKALLECRRVIAKNGVLRLFVPDLATIAEHYVSHRYPDSADWFMETSGLGLRHRNRGLLSAVVDSFRNSRHQWLWDESSLTSALRNAGFGYSRRATYCDSGDDMFDELERLSKWELALGIEAHPE